MSKNKLIPLIILLVLCIGLGGLWLFLSSKNYNEPEKQESTIVRIHNHVIDDLVAISFTDKKGEELSFVKEEHIWYLESDKKFPVDNMKVTEMFGTVSGILATRELPEDNGEFGFDDPKNVLTMKYLDEDGEFTYKFTVGNDNAAIGGTYVRDDINGKYYLCSTNPASAFDVARDDLFELDLFAADVSVTDVKEVTVFDGKGNVMNIPDEDNDGVDLFMEEAFDLLDLVKWVDYGVDKETMASKYGITMTEDSAHVLLDYKTTVTVKDENGESSAMRVDATFNVWFGNVNEDGTVYYTQDDSTIVYSLSAENYAAVMEFMSYTPTEKTETAETSASEVTE